MCFSVNTPYTTLCFRWNNLNTVKMEKEKTLEGASSIALFQNICDELKDWIQEKGQILDANELGKSMDSIQVCINLLSG